MYIITLSVIISFFFPLLKQFYTNVNNTLPEMSKFCIKKTCKCIVNKYIINNLTTNQCQSPHFCAKLVFDVSTMTG